LLLVAVVLEHKTAVAEVLEVIKLRQVQVLQYNLTQ
tara:strand:+ start:693 stop:800 length:108 start_codon:yes stop_codon:yes gene_type:complete